MNYRLWTISGLAIFFSGAGFAADLPSKIAPPAPPYLSPAPVSSWTGFYAGVNVGGEWSQSDWVFPATNTRTDHHENSGIAGGQIGYNWQFSNNWVIGLEGSADWADAEGGSVCPNRAFGCNTQEDFLGDLSARLGYAAGNALVFVKGGAGFADLDHSIRSQATGVTVEHSGNAIASGFLVGGGIEYAFLHNWTAKLEYDYMDFGSNSYTMTNVTTGIANPADLLRERHSSSVVKVGLNYLFNTSSPAIAARY